MSQSESSVHEVLVKEVLQVSGYSYLRVTQNNKELWLATPPVEAKEGETWYYEGGFEMVDFKSKELDRTFPSILFLDAISNAPIDKTAGGELVSPGAAMVKSGKKEISITPAAGAITIAELFSNKENYKEKTVRVTAEVTKFSPEIMNTNWIHLQDGTESEGNFDLTVTSSETLNVGDIVVLEGKITLDKDLGYGYFYEVLMEDAKIIK